MRSLQSALLALIVSLAGCSVELSGSCAEGQECPEGYICGGEWCVPQSTQADSATDVAKPDVAEPDVAEPDVAEPDVAEPDVAEPDALTDAQVDAEPDAQVDAEPDAQVDAEPDAQVDAEPDAQVDAEPDAQVDAEPDAQVDAEPDVQVDAEPDAQADAEPDAQADAELDAQVDAELDAVIPDSDGDGVLDPDDNCVDVINPDQADSDEDDLGDVCDSDRDGDTHPNDSDNCPDVYNFEQDNFDDDLMGDLCDDDRDGDGINNDDDNCPDTPNDEQADLDNDGIGDLCDDPSALIGLFEPVDGRLSLIDAARRGVRLGVRLSHPDNYIMRLWPSAGEDCGVESSPVRSWEGPFMGDDQVIFEDVASRWRSDLPEDQFLLCADIRVSADQPPIEGGLLQVEARFSASEPKINATMSFDGLRVTLQLDQAVGVVGASPELLHGSTCNAAAPYAPTSTEGALYTWWIPGAAVDAVGMDLDLVGWSVRVMIDATSWCFPVEIFTINYPCTTDDQIDALVGRMNASLSLPDACLPVNVQGGYIRLSGVCGPPGECLSSVELPFGRLDIQVPAQEGRAPRLTPPFGLPHGLPGREYLGTISDILGVQAEGDALSGVHLIGGGQYRHFSPNAEGAWAREDDAWNSQTRLAAADADGDGALDLLMSNGGIWGTYYWNRAPRNQGWIELNGRSLGYADHRFTTHLDVGRLDGHAGVDVALIAELGNPSNDPLNPYYPDGPDDPDPRVLVYRSVDWMNAPPTRASDLDDLEVTRPTGVLIADMLPGGREEIIVTRDASGERSGTPLMVFEYLGGDAAPTRSSLQSDLLLHSAAPTRALWDHHRELTLFARGGAVVVVNEWVNEVTALQIVDAPGVRINSIAAGDINGDGRDDLLVTDTLGEAFMLLREDGGYSAPEALSLAHQVERVVALNPPGAPLEAAFIYRGTYGFQLTRAIEAGSALALTELEVSVPLGFTLERAADLDGDGRDELLGTNGASLEIYNGSGLAQSVRGVRAYTTGDVEGDGRPDLIMAQRSEALDRTLITVNYDPLALDEIQIDGALQTTVRTDIERLAVGDVDGDGRGDVIACGEDSVHVFTVTGDQGLITLTEHGPAVASGGCQALIVADLIPGGANEVIFIDGNNALVALALQGDALSRLQEPLGFVGAELLLWWGAAGRPTPVLLEAFDGGARVLTGLSSSEDGDLEYTWQVQLPQSAVHGATADLRGRLQRDVVMLVTEMGQSYVEVSQPNITGDALQLLVRSEGIPGNADALVIADVDGDGVSEAIVQRGRVLRALTWQAPPP